MITLLADANIQRHISRLVARMQSETWRDFWEHLQLAVVSFADLELDPSASDEAIWIRCQDRQVFLLTNNRNDDGPTSLESTIRRRNTSESLPVFTIGDADSILTGFEYADRVIDRLFQYLLELDNIRGTGRLYLP